MKTEAWVLINAKDNKENELVKTEIEIEQLEKNEVLLKPLYGCLEGNMVHAISNNPINILKERGEQEIILGNAGVLEIEDIGTMVSKKLKKGDKVIYFCNGQSDEYGYPLKITGYDKKGSMGMMAKKIKLKEDEIIKIPENSKVPLEQWAGFSLKFITAWSNWNMAYNTWKIQMPDVPNNEIYVFGWGGGVTYAELLLAKKMGCNCTMITSKNENIKLCEENGIDVFNRAKYTKENLEAKLLEYINQKTNKKGVSIFIDNIGKDVYGITLKALGRQSVITTSGWKSGGMLPILRQNECQNRHTHVFTHYAKLTEGMKAMEFAEMKDWLPPICKKICDWEDIPKLIEDYKNGDLETYFPIYKIN